MCYKQALPCGIHVCLIESLRLRLSKVVMIPMTKSNLGRVFPWWSAAAESLGDTPPWFLICSCAALAAASRIWMSDIVLSNALPNRNSMSKSKFGRKYSWLLEVQILHNDLASQCCFVQHGPRMTRACLQNRTSWQCAAK
jgi:hypothetical protein